MDIGTDNMAYGPSPLRLKLWTAAILLLLFLGPYIGMFILGEPDEGYVTDELVANDARGDVLAGLEAQR